jgi:AcrR family transcriptional regulator
LHFVSTSASEPTPLSPQSRRRETELRITRVAQDLALERGYDGFTMDELAEATGVSRRTLFNYFPSKVDAIIGPPPARAEEMMSDLRARPANGQLFSDLAQVILAALRVDQPTRTEARRHRDLVKEPRVMEGIEARFHTLVEAVLEVAESRGEHISRSRARLATVILAALMHEALESYVDSDSETDLATWFEQILDEAYDLLR